MDSTGCYLVAVAFQAHGSIQRLSRFHMLAASREYIEALAECYARKPDEIPGDWRAAFDLLAAYFPGAGIEGPSNQGVVGDLVRRYAHLMARLDPLGRQPPERWNRLRSELVRRLPEMNSARDAAELSRLLEIYAGPLALETAHLDDLSRLAWIEQRRETIVTQIPAVRRRALAAVIMAETFESFMATKYSSKKRFGSEGAGSMYALVQRILDRAAAAGVQEVIIGTMHRGRLGLMAGLLGQAPAELFARLVGGYPFADRGRAADVPYHLGLVVKYHAPAGIIQVRLLPNPSHLEAVNSVAIGYARRRQEVLGSAARVLPLVLHTDASVIAQGVVSEALQLSDVPGHQVGGVLNVIVNNQIGFTTEPDEGRSSRHCTASWKAVDSLIVHVNGDHVDSVLAAADIAFDYREACSGESVIDLVCIRSRGHNELDEPRFTQPAYYDLAHSKPAISEAYASILLADNIVDADFPTRVAQQYQAELELAFVTPALPAIGAVPVALLPAEVSVPLEVIAELAARVPADGEFNSKAVRLVKKRYEEWQTTVSWPTAEILAFGTVLSIGWNVRLTGQDVERGAFSQRHLSLIDIASGVKRRIFEALPDGWGTIQVHNTPLCEYAALAFEYGYSVAADKTLTIWEAQFGDFANGAQIVLDQFISSGSEKWEQDSGLVLLLPHGLEGQGPEHSSGRIERVLQLAAKDNLRIAHPSTPSNYFHLLISQMERSPRRPLVIFSPKKLLRLKAATSLPVEFTSGGFQPVIVHQAPKQTRRVVLCSGKIYYDLVEGLHKSGRDDLTILRLEQLYPFPEAELAAALSSARSAEIVWVQEEPANYGAWAWICPRLRLTMEECGAHFGPLTFVARPESPSPAGSFHADHESDQARLVAAAIGAEEPQ
jgi:2-oxoglutarate dehydrogenase E1 component